MPVPKNQLAKRGLRYEYNLAKTLRLWAEGANWGFCFNPAFLDGAGKLHVPDIVLIGPRLCVLVEAKLSFRHGGLDQLRRYAPFVASFWCRPVVQVEICAVMRPSGKDQKQATCLSQLTEASHEGPFLWHMITPRLAAL